MKTVLQFSVAPLVARIKLILGTKARNLSNDSLLFSTMELRLGNFGTFHTA